MKNEDESAFVDVFHPPNSLEAGLIRETLEREGINVFVSNENFYNTGAILAIGADTISVMVQREDATRAKEVFSGLGLE